VPEGTLQGSCSAKVGVGRAWPSGPPEVGRVAPCCSRHRIDDRSGGRRGEVLAGVVADRCRSGPADRAADLLDDRAEAGGTGVSGAAGAAGRSSGEGGSGGGWALPPPTAGCSGVAGRLGGARAQPGPRQRTAPGDGPPAGEDRRDRFGSDHRAASGRPGDPRAAGRGRAERAEGLGGAPHPAGGCAHGDEEPAARTARPLLSRADPRPARRARHGWPRSVRAG
jgi:hypothetical protein